MLENGPSRSVLSHVHIMILANAANIPPAHIRLLEDTCLTVPRVVQPALEPIGTLERVPLSISLYGKICF